MAASFPPTGQATSADLTLRKHLEGEMSPVGNGAVEPIETAGQSPGANDLQGVRGDRLLSYASLQMTGLQKTKLTSHGGGIH